MQFSNYSNNIADIVNYFMKTFNLNSSRNVQLSKAYSGSTVIQGYIAASDNSLVAREGIQKIASGKFFEGAKIGSISIIQSTISTTPLTTPANTSSGMDTGALIAICVVLPLAIVIILALIIFFYRKYASQDKYDNGTNDEYKISDTIGN
jgi:hypothetical protein